MNLESAASFLQAVAPGEKQFHFAYFDDHKDRKNKALAGERYGTLQQWGGHLDKAERAGCGVFFTVQRTDGNGRKASNIAEYRLIFAEWDNKGVPLPDWPIRPHAVVESSPGKFHVYWRVAGLQADAFKGIMSRMVAMGSDPAAKDAARVLRLPGTLHQKDPAAPFMVRLVENFDAPPYPVGEMLQAFPPVEQPTKPRPSQHPRQHGQQVGVLDDLRGALAFLSSDAYADWIAVGLSLKTMGDEGLDLWMEWSARSEKFDSQAALDKWASFAPTATGYQSIFAKARLAGWKNKSYAAQMAASTEAHEALAAGGDVVSFEAEKSKRKKDIRQDDIKDPGGLLLVDKFGKPISCAANAQTMLLSLPQQFGFNEMSGECAVDGATIDDGAAIKLLIGLQQSTGVAVCKDHFYDGLYGACSMRPFHPVRDWLNSLAWDGTPRVNRFLHMLWGVEECEYAMRAGIYILASAIKRAMMPGYKADNMAVFEGPQGARKSSSIILFFGGAWHANVSASVSDKDFYQNLRGKWVVEFSEMTGISKSDAAHIKDILSAEKDTYRASYGRSSKDWPRGNIFIGTTNDDAYLRDATGDRRFLPIRVGRVRMDWIEMEREQIWAEAMARMDEFDALPWFEVPGAKEQQELRFQVDPWEEHIAGAIEFQNSLTVGWVLGYVLGIPTKDWTQAQKQRVAAILKRLGWECKPEWLDGKTQRVYRLAQK